MRVPRPAPRSAHEDDDTHAHSTLSAEDIEVQVFYPFHPLHGATVRLRRPERGEGAVSVIDRAGKRLKIPVWMLSPEAAGIMISERVHFSKEALLSLTSLLSLHAGEDRDHDNLLPTAVNECQGGHRGATGTIGPDDPERNRVNHDKLMGQVAKRVEDKRLLKLIRAFLNAGVMENGLVSPSVEGTPQGGPLTPLTQKVISNLRG